MRLVCERSSEQCNAGSADTANPAHSFALYRIGLGIGICLLAIRVLSPQFAVGSPPETWAVCSFVGLLILAGCLWLKLFRQLGKPAGGLMGLGFLWVTGLLMRLLFLGSTPIYEDDWQRYLWDGASLAQGVNPYTHAPASAAPYTLFGEPIPLSEDPSLRRLQNLAQQYPDSHRRINFPYVSTIYPPLAQLAFAAAHEVSPFSLDAWRMLLLLTDCVTLALLLAALRAYKLSGAWSLLFWWNPLAIYVTANAAHMDALLLTPLVATLLLVKKNRPWTASLTLAVAVGIKFWPLLLAPLIFRRYRRKIVRYSGLGTSVAAFSCLFVAPMMLSLDPQHSGLLAYSQSWERNAFLFPLLSKSLGLITTEADPIARLAVAVCVLSATLWFTFRSKSHQDSATGPLLAVTAMLFFLAPTGYPWYGLWLLIFLPFTPRVGIGALTACLPLYYARYALDAANLSWINGYILIPVQFGLPLLLLIKDAVKTRMDPRTPPPLESPGIP